MSKRIASLVLLMTISTVGILGYINLSMNRCQERVQVIIHTSFQELRSEMQLDIDGVQMDLQEYENLIPQLVAQRMPSVVAVHAEHATAIDFETGKSARMSAAGVVIGKNGLILTASHVVDDLNFNEIRRFWVIFADGTEREVKKIAYVGGRDPDMGLIWIDPNGLDLYPVPVEEWENVAIQGEQVLVCGSPYGNDHSASTGIVSCANRMARGPQSGDQLLIQVDAPINGGNSGGPVFDMEGKLIGIVSWKFNADGLSFIVPVSRILEGLQTCLNNEMEVEIGVR